MPNKNNRNSLIDCLMNRKVVMCVLVAVFVAVSLASPTIAQASADAVLVMHFDEGSGMIVKDESGYGNDGTIHGATWAIGVSGKALSFDWRGPFVEMPNIPSLNFGSGEDFTLECWAKTTFLTREVEIQIVGKYPSKGVTPVYMIMWTSAGTARSIIRDSKGNTGTLGKYLTGSTLITDGKWHHIALVRDAGVEQKLYVDGMLEASQGDNTVDLTNLYSLYVGAHVNRYFSGSVDEIALYSKALTPEEIQAHYLAKRAGGSTKESASDLISSVSIRIDVLKRNNVDTSLIEQALKNSQNAYDSGKYDEAYELAQNAQKMADDAYEAQQHIESAQSEIDEAKSIGADVKDAENKLKEARDTLKKGNYEYAKEWADDASKLAKHASVGSVQIKDLKALAPKYDGRTVVISGTIRDIETVYGKGYAFALDDSTGMISVAYQGSLGDIKEVDKVTASGIFQTSTGTVVADTVQKSGVGGVPGFEFAFAIAGLLTVACLLRRRK